MWRTLLAHYPKLSYTRHKKLFGYFSVNNNFKEAELAELAALGLDESWLGDFLAWRDQTNEEKIVNQLNKESIQVVSFGDGDYPPLLAQINDPPLALFVRGKLPADNMPYVAIVGTRHCTSYGRMVAESMAKGLSERGIVTVSGLALGIDGIAHAASLKTGTPTVAVLGSGVNKFNVYPRAHYQLSEQIIANGGAIVSEYPPGMPPSAYSFPARNRIIAGLSLATLVIEAPISSGALITAHVALDYNREVMAVPHSINSAAGAGCNKLLAAGAHLIQNAEDVITALNIAELVQSVSPRQPATPENDLQKAILGRLNAEPQSIDALARLLGLTAPQIAAALTLMEVKGIVKNLGATIYGKNAV